jgi:hypothetical protein
MGFIGWSTTLCIVLVYGLYLNPDDVAMDTTLCCGIVIELENMLFIPFLREMPFWLRVQRMFCYIMCLVGLLYDIQNEASLVGLFGVCFEMITALCFRCVMA